MYYRTKTYIAADWSGEKEAIDQLYKWKNGQGWGLDFVDAHDLTNARDTSLNCSIKKSLKTRLDRTKRFVLIVGLETDKVSAGSCRYCSNYNSYQARCLKGYSLDFKSYVKYECHIAKQDISNIVVLYNAAGVNRNKCPEVLRYIGKHVAMKKIENGRYIWDYSSVKSALEQ